MLVEFACICAAFLGAYLVFVDGTGTNVERAAFLATLPVLLASAAPSSSFAGLRRVWRFAGARDLVAIATGC